ncbi:MULTISPECIES: hypothetical protein [unclassified Mesorhizobium]|uniref:hypothetical protein n=1 Tax=unclassified Mesorhizobium TaxID=325217 RepID=UPI00112981CB|nr:MULTISPECIES: hypothetical protein [unclassified Mesorhizobium]TPI44961.1 hypothetical protein FJW11_30015 [Mesorhizobium sp. B3-1-1]TPJ57111.1 hypothetical protein FJ462_32265 [Mesorhizobium sp. B2-6-7]TPJ75527.1 hypothetical protein FJ422_31020 [Mesorhizobium sp. B2-6-3]TPJ90212.1 hypothetical protein FJ491_31955 [Mesorhizobium sp. B2-5-10]TPK03009.1 hypothetical protein FJ490_32055 [Mesorhizobium sp. B2-5-11]
MDDVNVKLGVQAYILRRNAAWTAMLKAAARQHAMKPITANRIKADTYAKLYGDSARGLASTHGVKAKTVRTLRDMLEVLFGMADSNGSEPEEIFQRFEDFNRAHKRVRNTRRDKPRHVEEENYPYIGFAQMVKNSTA